MAFALAEETKQHGLKCDAQCMIDTARVLRIPHTFNCKSDPRLGGVNRRPSSDPSHIGYNRFEFRPLDRRGGAMVGAASDHSRFVET